MGLIIIRCALALVVCASASASPFSEAHSFLRSAVETVPAHDSVAPPIRSSVESIPLRNLRDESEGRIPLRDAVEKRPIATPDAETLYKLVEDAETLPIEDDVEKLRHYYGAASYLNTGKRNDERLHQGNANLQAMQQAVLSSPGRRLVVCYLQSWAAYRSPPLAFTAGLVPRSCTHLHYAFAGIHPHTYTIVPSNEDYDVVKGGYRFTTGLKHRQPGLRVLISVGGDGTERLFSEMVEQPNRRLAFIGSIVEFLKEYDFDGLDLHWAYAGEKSEKDKDNLSALLYELREKFSEYGFLLSTVLPPIRYQIEDGYDISAVSGAVDYAILQGWDMTHRNQDEAPSRALQHSALHRDPGAAGRDQKYDNIEFMVKFIIRRGMAADKLVLGVPLFGRSYTLAPSTLPAPGALASDWGAEGQYTQTKGMLAFFEICMKEVDGKGTSSIDEFGNSYAVFDNQWVSFDSPLTIVEKMKFVISTGLGGAAAWSIDMDDFRGLCGSPFPVLSAIATSLNGESVQSDQSSLKLGSCDEDDPYLSSDEDSCAHFRFCSGSIHYRMVCEDDRLYDPSTGFCGHQDATKCIPGQSLRISVDDAMRFLSHAYETDFEWNQAPMNGAMTMKETERIVESGSLSMKKSKDNDKRVVCYMTSWAFYRRGDGKFVPEHIDSRLCTHVVYAYASLTPDELVAKEFDPWADLTNNLYERVTSLNDVKVLLGLGGWTDSAGDKYSRLVSSASSRAKFAERLIPFLKMHNFDGLHLDWNYPVCWQSNCKKGAGSDKANFAKFAQELSKALHDAGMEFGIAVSGYKEVIEAAYDLPALSRAADFLSTMTYDYHGGWERKTAHHTPLLSPQNEALSYYSIEYAIKALISGGADPKKLNLGLSFYGQSFRLADVEAPGIPGAVASGPGEPGEFTKQPGMLAYYEICYRVKNLRWKTGRQANAGPYTYADNQWVGYDDPKSITEKVEWALRQGIGGVTAWAIDLDDFNNRCCTEPSPLLRAAGRALGRHVPQPPTSQCERPPQPVTPAPPTTTTVAADGSAGGSGGHDHGSHGDHHTSTWPSWNPGTTTTPAPQTWWPQPTTTSSTTPAQQTWWPQPTTTSSTTTTTKRTTTTTTTTTTRRPTAAPARPTESNLEGTSCIAGEYRPAPGDCGAYLQCESGQWRKQKCAPGLHWFASAGRCDWPSFAKCKETSSNEQGPTTTTLAPTTARPPPTTTTTRRPYTTTTTTTTTTTQRPTTTTQRTTTTSKPSYVPSPGGNSEGSPCDGQDYAGVAGDCNSYLHCDGYVWRQQKCAPGLHWSTKQKNCDWPKYANCNSASATIVAQKPTARPPPKPVQTTTTRRPEPDRKQEGSPCGGNDFHTAAKTCDGYLLCVSGQWKKQQCPSGLNWDDAHKRCDWPEFAMCKNEAETNHKHSTTTTRRPLYPRPQATTKRPTTAAEVATVTMNTRCSTGTYHAHPKCNKFSVCVNGMLITQNCAPGLVWNAPKSQCDFPNSASCTDKRENGGPDGTMMQLTSTQYCNSGEYAMFEGDCTRYKHCLFGKFEEFSCSAGLHWNQDKQICDWPKNAKCKKTIGSTPNKPFTNPALGPPSKPEEPHEHGHESEFTTKPATSKPLAPIHSSPSSKPALLNSQYKLVCYYTNWAWYRPGHGKYGPEDIDPSLCTHIVYGFAVLGSDGLMTAHDPWADIDNQFYEKVIEYKKYGTKVSLAIGGWNDSAGDKYSKLVNDPSARARFVEHAVEFLEKYGFDGLDLDWEYPKCWQVDCSKGPDSDKDGFAALVRELSAVMKPKGLLLSSAVSPNKKVIDAGYDVHTLARHLDWIAVMTYDYHGQWDKKTGHVAPMYYHPDDDNTYFNANYTMHYWLSQGAPASKLVMGMPLYGQSFTIGAEWDTSPEMKSRLNQTGLNVPAVSGGEAGEYTRAKGFLAYYEICDRIRNKGWKVAKDPYGRMGPYAYKGNQWVSFDDVEIIKRKVAFIKSLKLAGGMVWALDLDDFRNRCGEGKHPLLNTIKRSLLDKNINSNYLPSQPMIKPPTTGNDLDDIEVRPGYTKKPTTSRPMVQTTQMSHVHTTRKPTTSATVHKEEPFKVVCYYTNWAWYRPESGKFSPSDIDPSLCTHIVYAFAVLDTEKLIIKSHDAWLDVENKFYEKVIAFKSHGIKVTLGLGGWNDSAGDKYSRLVNNPSARRTFVIHAIDFIEQFGFDGLDLDWEYPKCWQVECEKGPNSDKQGFASLVKELRTAFAPRGLLLSAAVSASKRVIDAGYDVPTLSNNLDWIAVMTYDYHGQWDKKTGHVAPMYARVEDDEKTFNANFSMHYWMNKGAAAKKLVMGVPLYGQSFSLSEGAGSGLGAAAYAGGEPGDETRARGFLAFYEICERVRIQGWKVHRDPGGSVGPYATLKDQWVSFDDDFMVRHKAEYIRSMGFGGGMVWAMDLDDFTGRYCDCGKFPLLANLNHVLRGKSMPASCPLQEVQATESSTTTTVASWPVSSVPEPTEHYEPSVPQTETELVESGSSLNGKTCSGVKFTAHTENCSKYYLCNNGHYVQLTCPAPLHWNKNHCDWPAKSSCRGKAQLRLTAEGLQEIYDDKPIVACYFTNWAYYRKDIGRFGPEQIDSSLCTHIVYTWAHLDPKSFKIIPGNAELDIENDFFGKVTELRLKGVKTIIGVGGLEDSEDSKWSVLAASENNRKAFIASALEFIKRWNFDGLQIGWQYPVCKQTPCSEETNTDREYFSALLLELSRAMRPLDLELSAMVSASPAIASMAYDNVVLSATVDWLSIAANDYYASASGKASYLMDLANDDSYGFNTITTYWTSVVPARQLVFGVPAYARTYTLRDSASSAPGSPANGPGVPGEFTDVPGFMAYYEICSGVLSNKWKATSTKEGTFAVAKSQWASYLNPKEVNQIARSIKEFGGRGAALWAIDLDDWRGTCKCQSYPLLRSLRNGLEDSSVPIQCS